MRNEFARNLDLAQAKIQYDEQCKKVLGDKNILSWIMQRTVSEYAGMSREEIMKCIEGEPEIGSRRVNPGETNASRIAGLSNEDKVNEVYSIWICMNAPKYIGNAISEYKLEKTDLIPGIPDRRKEYDKLSIVMVCLNTKKETDDQFLGILQTLFNTELPEKEKKDRLQKTTRGQVRLE